MLRFQQPSSSSRNFDRDNSKDLRRHRSALGWSYAGFGLLLCSAAIYIWLGSMASHGATTQSAEINHFATTIADQKPQPVDLPQASSMVYIGPQRSEEGRATDDANDLGMVDGGLGGCDDVAFAVDAASGLAYATTPGDSSKTESLGSKSNMKSKSRALRNNASVSGTVPINQYHYYQVCVPIHPLQHTSVSLHLSTPMVGHEAGHATSASSYNGDLYISTDDPRPTFDHATWISADVGPEDSIEVATYLEDFMRAPATPSGRGKVLSVGVFGRAAWRHGAVDLVGAPGVPYTLQVAISTVSGRVLDRRSALRGGRRPLPGH